MQQIRDLIAQYPSVTTLFWLAVLLLAAIAVNYVVKLALVRLLNRLIARIKVIKGADIVDAGIITRLSNAAPALVVASWIMSVPGLPPALAAVIRNVANAYIILVIAMAVIAAMHLGEKIWRRKAGATGKSIKGYIQVATIIVYGVAAILMIAAIIDQSPLILLSGLGALTAVLILVFQDTLLSFVASIQISSSDMVKVGDWITMPSANVDGDVIDIALHTVRVQNFDKTITTLPTRKLVSEPVTNWRGMTDAGGRRIKRALYIDQASIRFLTDEEAGRLARVRALSAYMDRKTEEIEKWNAELGEAAETPLNRRRMTNIGTFRAYVEGYLGAHPLIRDDLTLMVRQLPPGPQGLPIEIYCFTNTTEWAKYEAIQADIFDHLAATVPEFGLTLFQVPSGHDLARGGFGAALSAGSGT